MAMLLDIPKHGRRAFQAQISSEERDDRPWGTLGVPERGAGDANLLHIFAGKDAILRHAFYGPGAQVPRHVHAMPELVYGVGGPCRERSDGGSRSKRRLTYHPAGFAHSLDYEGPTHVLAVEFGDGIGRRLGLSLPERTLSLPATHFGDIWDIMSKIVQREPVEAVDAAIDAVAARIAAFAAAEPPIWLETIVDHVHRDWKRPPAATRLAALVDLSPHYLCRAFKRWMGVTLQQYGLLIRVDRARAMLWGTDIPIPQIAAETGFSDQSHMTRALRTLSQKTPLRLRWSAPCLAGRDRLE